MTRLPGKDAFVQQLVADGHRFVFGNPGTTEQGFIEALRRDGTIEYILTLQEGVAVGMADGYARAARTPAVVQLHCSPGLGNAMGLLYDAYVGHTPLVVYVGQQSRELIEHEPMLPGRPADLARPLVKAAYEVQRAADIPVLLRRATNQAMHPPQGPVCLAIPSDVLEEEADYRIEPSTAADWRAAPVASAISAAAALITEAKNPVIVAGDGIGLSEAEKSLEALAYLVGCPIYTVLPSQSSVDTEFPLFAGNLNVVHPETITDLFRDVDVMIAVGTPLFPVLHPPLPVLDATRIIQIDANAERLGSTYASELAMTCDPRLALEAITRLLESSAAETWQTVATVRRARTAERKVAAYTRFRAKLEESDRNASISPFGVVAQVAAAMPANAIIFEDAPTMSGLIQRGIARDEPGSLLMARGGGLGQGMPGTLGVKLARPDRAVIGIVGDGSAHYTIQSLWTAARYEIPVTYLICNNGGYRILGRNMAAYRGDEHLTPYDPIFHIDAPEPDFVRLAEGYGVTARRAETIGELREALNESIAADGPRLIDVQVEEDVAWATRRRKVQHATAP